MKLPNWFKITWWIILLLLTGMILFKRYEAITTGQSVPADIFVFLIFVALMLVPIFSEIEFFGLKLKREIEELKADIEIKFGEIKVSLQRQFKFEKTKELYSKGYGIGPIAKHLNASRRSMRKYIRLDVLPVRTEPVYSPLMSNFDKFRQYLSAKL